MTRNDLIDKAVRELLQDDQAGWCDLDQIEDCSPCVNTIHSIVKSNWQRHVQEMAHVDPA